MKKKLTILCSVFNEESSIATFYDKYLQLKKNNKNYEIDLIFSNNGSKDKTLNHIIELRQNDKSVQYITLSRNFSYQASLQALLSVVNSDAIVFIDIDCEDPPEMINDFIKKWEEGYELVYGRRIDREENFLIKKCRLLYYKILKLLSDDFSILYMAEFSLMTRNFYQNIRNITNTFPYMRSDMSFAGFKHIGINYKRQIRIHGRSHYNIVGMIVYGFAGILSASTYPLRLCFFLFPVICLLNLLTLYFVFNNDNSIIFSSMVIINLSYFTFSFGFISIYIARIYKNSLGKPLFIIDKNNSCLNENQFD